MNNLNRTRWHCLLAALLALVLVVLAPLAAPGAGRSEPLAPPPSQQVIPIEEQPFYPDLMAATQRWADSALAQVVGDSPRDTLLNFYAVMARVQHDLETVTANPLRDPGWRWSPAARRRIRAAETLFAQAVDALDTSVFPESVRADMADEAAMQLKEVLDHVFSHSTVPITIPGAAGMKQLNDSRSQPSQSWTLANTAITLAVGENASEEKTSEINTGFRFTGGTVRQIGRMYEEIRNLQQIPQPYATPGLYGDYITTPGYLAAPKWYLRLPPALRRVLEMEHQGQTVLQIATALAVLLLYGWLLRQIGRRLLHTYRHRRIGSGSSPRGAWLLDNLAWKRVLLTLPLLPLTWLGKTLIDDSVNITGTPLLVITYLFFIAYFIAAGFFFFFLFEAGEAAGWGVGAAAAAREQSGDAGEPDARRPGGGGADLPAADRARPALRHRAGLFGRAGPGNRSGGLEAARQPVRRPVDPDRPAGAGGGVLPDRREPGLRHPHRPALAGA
jgi:MscS family membrane protein